MLVSDWYLWVFLFSQWACPVRYGFWGQSRPVGLEYLQRVKRRILAIIGERRLLYMFLVLIDRSSQFWIGALVALCIAGLLYSIVRFGLRRFRFSKHDMRAAGLNRREQRRFVATRKRKKRAGKIRF